LKESFGSFFSRSEENSDIEEIVDSMKATKVNSRINYQKIKIRRNKTLSPKKKRVEIQKPKPTTYKKSRFQTQVVQAQEN